MPLLALLVPSVSTFMEIFIFYRIFKAKRNFFWNEYKHGNSKEIKKIPFIELQKAKLVSKVKFYFIAWLGLALIKCQMDSSGRKTKLSQRMCASGTGKKDLRVSLTNSARIFSTKPQKGSNDARKMIARLNEHMT